MLVRITPPGRRARILTVSDVPRSWDIAGGCATAEVPIVLDREEAERILLAKVETADWAGVVWRRPRYGQPLECAGQAIGLTDIRGKEYYGWGAFIGELVDYNGTNWEKFTRSTTGGVVRITLTPGQTSASGDCAGYQRLGDVELTSIKFTAYVPHADCHLRILPMDVDGTIGAAVYDNDTPGTVPNQTVTFAAGTYGFVVEAYTDGVIAATTTDYTVSFYDARLHSTALSSITAATVIGHCLDKLPAHVLPAGTAYRRYISTAGSAGTAIDAVGFTDPRDDLKKRIDTVVGMTDHHFGFYPRRVGNLMCGVPVFAQIPTTPTLLLDVRDAETDGLKDVSASDLASDYIANYTDEDGRTRYATVTDTNPAHYFNVIGYDRTGTVDANWTSSAATAAAAGQVTADAAERGCEGSLTITRARLLNGRDVPLSFVMPGTLARVRGIGDGTGDLVVRNCAMAAGKMTVAFGNPLDLKTLTARTRK